MGKLLLFFCMLITLNVFGQKVKNDTQSHIIRTYPSFNLPQEDYTYDIEVLISDGGTLSDYKLNASRLRKNYFTLNLFTFDSLQAKLHLELFIDAKPYQFSYTTTKDEKGQAVFNPIMISQFSGVLAVYLDDKMIDYKTIVLSPKLAGSMDLSPSEYFNYQDTCTTAYQDKTTDLKEVERWVNLAATPPEPYENQVLLTNAQQIQKLYKMAATYFKDKFDLRYKKSASTFFKVKTKEENVVLDTTYKAVLTALKEMRVETYENTLKKLSSSIEVWKEEKRKYTNLSPENAPFVWVLCMNMARASDLLEDYKGALVYWKEADQIGVDRKESTLLKASIQQRADRFYLRYDETGIRKNIEPVYLNHMRPEEEVKIREQKKAEILYALLEKEAYKYRFSIKKEPGHVFTLDGKTLNGILNYNPERRMGDMDVPFSNMLVFDYKNTKGKDRQEVYKANEIKGFKLSNGVSYESVLIEQTPEEKVKNLMREHRRFYRVLYQSAEISLYKYENQNYSQYTFKLAGEEIGHCTGFGDFYKEPNRVLSEILKKSPTVSKHVADVGIILFTDDSLVQICESYTRSVK